MNATVKYIRSRIAADPGIAWPAEIDDILDDAESRLPRVNIERLASLIPGHEYDVSQEQHEYCKRQAERILRKLDLT